MRASSFGPRTHPKPKPMNSIDEEKQPVSFRPDVQSRLGRFTHDLFEERYSSHLPSTNTNTNTSIYRSNVQRPGRRGGEGPISAKNSAAVDDDDEDVTAPPPWACLPDQVSKAYTEREFVKDLCSFGLHLEPVFTRLIYVSDKLLFSWMPLFLLLVERRIQLTNDFDDIALQLSIIKARISSNRALKLRFILLTSINDVLKTMAFWKPTFVFDEECYEEEQLVLKELWSEFCGNKEELYSKEQGSVNSALGRDWTQSTSCLMTDDMALEHYVSNVFFHPKFGVMRTEYRIGPMKKVQNAFNEMSFLVCLTSDLGVDADQAQEIARRMLNLGLITKVTNLSGGSFGASNNLYVRGSRPMSLVSTARMQLAAGVYRPKPTKGMVRDYELKVAQGSIKMEWQMALDIIDIQSIQFWKVTAFQSAERNVRDVFDYRIIVHPFHCASVKSLACPDNRSSLGQLAETTSCMPTEDQGIEMIPAQIAGHNASTVREANGLAKQRSSSLPRSYGATLINQVQVRRIFGTSSRPMLLSTNQIETGQVIDIEDLAVTNSQSVLPCVISKSGDKLANDLDAEIAFRLFNLVWSNDKVRFADPLQVPFAFSYDVVPTGSLIGLMEFVPGFVSLNEWDWDAWTRENRGRPEVLDSMICSAAGSHIAAYVLQARDRHLDNIIVKDSRVMLHIDFGFLLGEQAPLEGPRFSIPKSMMSAFVDLGIWNTFVKKCGQAFSSLRYEWLHLSRLLAALFVNTGRSSQAILELLASKYSFNLAARSPAEAEQFVTDQVESAPIAWETFLRGVSHNSVDPFFYKMVEMRFPPALLAQKLAQSRKPPGLASDIPGSSTEANGVKRQKRRLLGCPFSKAIH